ncbi:MAG TPA: hypothetical protein VEC11_03665 [Allosphingosinicella sp.]|nr:hypothetical protein [Allosphingosinicella sp.]
MKTELALARRLTRLTLALGAAVVAAGAAQAQERLGYGSFGGPVASSPSGGGQDGSNARDGDPQAGEEPRPSRRRSNRPQRARTDVSAYLEVAQVLSADLDSGGETLTYTSVAAGVDGTVQTRRVTAQVSYRYERDIDWQDGGIDRDAHAGLAMVNLQVVPGALQIDAGGLATRTGGDGRVFGVTNRTDNVDVYSAYVGPTLSTHAGPLAINASYRLGSVWVDDHRPNSPLDEDFDHSTAQSATASIGMAPGRGLPIGWTVSAGYAREDTSGRFDQEFQGMYVRGDIVVPLSATLAVTAGVGYEDIEASQLDFVRDAGGFPVIGPNGPTPDPSAPRLLTYDQSGLMYDGGIIWRPSPRTELQVRAGHRYGGTTYSGSLDHQINEHQGVHAEVFDTVETFGRSLTNDFAGLPVDLDVNRDPLTGGLGGCAFSRSGQGGRCFDRSLSSITGSTFRARGGSLVFSGERGLWSYGIGAGYVHRRYARPALAGVSSFAQTDDSWSVYGSIARQLSRTSEVNFDAFASWYSNDVDPNTVRTLGATFSYNRSLFLERLRLLASVGIYNTDDGIDSATNASALGGLRYTF